MTNVQKYIGHSAQQNGKNTRREDFVLEKSIFSNVFKKDIRRVYIYKKAERIAKALNLIAPAFNKNVTLRERLDSSALAIIDAAMLEVYEVRTQLPRELLALSSMLSMARMSGVLSPMNAEIITQEAHALLEEVTGYEDTTLVMEEMPTISVLAKNTATKGKDLSQRPMPVRKENVLNKGQVKDTEKQTEGNKDRKTLILGIIQSKGRASIKDISTVVRGVSEKTIQRELLSLVGSGIVTKAGERRWSTYSLA
jgi:hypothetical protein